MTRNHYDLILVGGGLANSLIAWRLQQLHPTRSVLILERGTCLGGNHTWSFHDGDLTAQQRNWIAPLISHHWPGYEIAFPELDRRLPSGYNSILSDHFAEVLASQLGEVVHTGQHVNHVSPTSVVLSDGRELTAEAVIDGRGPTGSPSMALGFQTFLGQEIRTASPHGVSLPVIMDARVEQGDGYRFVYLLPFSPDRILIEDTHYVDDVALGHDRLQPDQLRTNIQHYAQDRGWDIAELLREEQGALPITLAGDWDAFWPRSTPLPRAGLRAGLFHPTTGYSLPHAVRLADEIAALPNWNALALYNAIRSVAQREWREQGFFRLLNRMLFLAGEPQNRWRVMQRFYRLPEGLIERFYAQRLTAADKLRIVSGKPPVPVGQAIRAALRTQPKHFRNNA